MSITLLVLLGLVTTSPEPGPGTESSITAAAPVSEGSSAPSSVELLRQALICESQGLESERRRLLELAVKTDPDQLDGPWIARLRPGRRPLAHTGAGCGQGAVRR